MSDGPIFTRYTVGVDLKLSSLYEITYLTNYSSSDKELVLLFRWIDFFIVKQFDVSTIQTELENRSWEKCQGGVEIDETPTFL